jgi:hypothetical protein
MNGPTLRLLRQIARRYDITLEEALGLCPRRHRDFRDQYPLAMLIEGEYVGVTLEHIPPKGAEKMREFSQATLFHSMKGEQADGAAVSNAGLFIDTSKEHVFIKAKGALYLDDLRRKSRDRMYSFLVGVLVGVCTLSFKAWIDSRPNKSLQPTGTAVTPPAAQEIAPAVPVAEH